MNKKEIRKIVDEIIECTEDEKAEIFDRAGIYAASIPEVAVAYGIPFPTMGAETPAPIDVISTMGYLDLLKMKSKYKDIKTMIYRLKFELKKIGETFTLVDALEVSKKSFDKDNVPEQYDNRRKKRVRKNYCHNFFFPYT